MLKIDKLKIGALPRLSFDVRPGECLAVEGPSGIGKTRLLRAIADLDAVDGHVTLEGTERRDMAAPAWRRRVRYVSAEPGWWADTAMAHAPAAAAARQRFRRMLSQLDVPPAALDRAMAELSTGERRRIGLALALADEPTVLLLDEPTLGLDAARGALVDELIRFQMLAGRIVMLATHDIAQIERLAERRLLLAAPEQASARPPVTPPAPHGAGSIWTGS
jgi:ABC-type multidrug transport system ATPase subunit